MVSESSPTTDDVNEKSSVCTVLFVRATTVSPPRVKPLPVNPPRITSGALAVPPTAAVTGNAPCFTQMSDPEVLSLSTVNASWMLP